MPKQAKQLRKPYKGLLNKPIVISAPSKQPSILTGDSASLEDKERLYQAAIQAQQIQKTNLIGEVLHKKMNLLKQHYGLVDENDVWYQVALNLAVDHVPGFTVIIENERGRKTVWTPAMHAKLYLDVLDATNGILNARLIEAACISLIEKEPWSSFVKGKSYSKPDAKTLQNQFSIARKTPLAMMIQALPKDQKNLAYEFVDHLSKNSFP